jgi:aminoglycoside/choline kinase family phosphotransferase
VWAGEHPDNIINLPSSGSERRYYRIIGGNKQAIGAFNPNNLENKAFIGFTKHFRKYRLPVPDIYDFNPDQNIYLIQDLGNRILYDILQEQKTYGFSVEMQEFFKEVIEELLKFQILAGKDLNYSLCYPRASFDRQSMLWDLNYFKYHFLKLARIPFDEQKLEDDFNSLMAFLLEAGSDFFMYRDFQSRNIMVQENKPYFIDYQGGRKGPLQYDLASLLFQVKADIPFDIREQLLDFYISRANIYTSIDGSEFKKYYYGFVYIRLLQVMGAYGYRYRSRN